MPTQTETSVAKLKINRLTQSQFDGATTQANELYFVDPEFTGGKLLETNSNGDIIESDVSKDSFVTDVQVNGTSVVTNGVASIPNPLPSQSGQSGKFLTTNGSSTSWASVSGGTGSLTDIAEAGNNITFETVPYGTLNITTVGSPSISSTFVASNFTDADYLTTLNIINNTSSGFEIVIAFKQSSLGSGYCLMDTVSPNYGIRIQVGNEGRFLLRVSSDGSSYFINKTGTHTISNNVKYFVKVRYNSTTGYSLLYSTDGGENYTTDITDSLTTLPYSNASNLIFGDNASASGYYFNGSIYLADTYINVNNGEYEWHAVNITGEKQRINSSELPSQSGQSGKFLTTNGTSVSWGNAQPALTSTTVTLYSSSWSSSTQTVNVAGMTATKVVWVSPSGSSMSDYADAGVYCSAQGSGTLTFTCSTTPVSNLTVQIVFG